MQMQEEEYTGERTGMSETVIQVSHVSKLYKLYDRSMDRLKESLGLSKGKHREHYALKDLSFEVRKGECVGMIGILSRKSSLWTRHFRSAMFSFRQSVIKNSRNLNRWARPYCSLAMTLAA